MEPTPAPQQTAPQPAPSAPVDMPNAAPGFQAPSEMMYGQQSQAPQGPTPGNQAKLEFHIEGPNGKGTVDEQYVAQSMGMAGYNVANVSPDGSKITLQGPQGVQEMTTADALKQMGWNVSRVMPLAADYENVQMPWRAAITKFSDDDEREAYLTAKLKRSGIQEPQLMGSGRDWHVFNPGTGSWIGLTNNPDWDMSDMAEAAIELPRMFGAGLGGAMSGIATGGVGAVPGAMLGAAAGGAIGDTLTRGLMAMDDDYKDIAFDKNLAETGGDILKNAAIDAAGVGVLGLGGKIVSKIAPISGLMRGGGRAAEDIGSVMAGTSRAMQSGVAKDFFPYLTPGLETPASIGAISQLPSQAVRWAAKGPGALHGAMGSDFMKKALGPRMAKSLQERLSPLQRFSTNIQQMRRGRISDLGKGLDDKVTTSDITGNLAEMITKGTVGRTEESMARRAGSQAIDDALRAGKSMNEATTAANKAYRDMQTRIQSMPEGAGRIGESAGRMLQGIESLGKGAESVARGLYTGGTYVGRGVGKGMEYGGRATRMGGQALRPVEPYMYGAYGAEQVMGPGSEESRAWRFPGGRRNIKSPHTWASL